MASNTSTTHDLIVPTRKKLNGHLMFNPVSPQRNEHFPLIGGQRYNRGHKMGDAIAELWEYDDEGKCTHRSVVLRAPADGYVTDLPAQPCYVESGEVLGTFREGYVYHLDYYGEQRSKFSKWKRVFFYKNPRIHYAYHLTIATMIALAALVPIWLGWWKAGISPLLLLAATPYALVSALLLAFGKKQVGTWFSAGFKWLFETTWVSAAFLGLTTSFYVLLFLYSETWFGVLWLVPGFLFADGLVKIFTGTSYFDHFVFRPVIDRIIGKPFFNKDGGQGKQ